jgi:hypothetical protein
VIFVDLRDREGLVQIVCDPDRRQTFATAESIRNEYCLRVVGMVASAAPLTERRCHEKAVHDLLARIDLAAGKGIDSLTVLSGNRNPGLSDDAAVSVVCEAISRELAQAHGGDLTLAETGPEGAVFALTLPSTVKPTLSLTAGAGVSGNFTVTVTGTSGALVHSAVVNVSVVAQDFKLTVSPSVVTAPRGVGGSFTVTVTPLTGFTGSVQLQVTGQKPGDYVQLSRNPITGGSGTSTVTISPSWADSPGLVQVVVTGTSNGLTHSASTLLQIS